jgi:uncharacterized protein involved in exopolysaccharide biosynthesis
VLDHWKRVVFVPLTLAALAGGLSYLLTPRYSATAAFFPEAASTTGLPANLASLAQQFGFNVGGEARQSAVFYADLVHSRRVLQALLTTNFKTTGQSTATLLEQLRIKESSPDEAIDRGVRLLRDRITTSIDARSGVGTVTVQMPAPQLAADVANTTIDLLNSYNRTTRQSQARERRMFAEARVREVELRVRGLEDSMRVFYEQNVQWESSPRLRFMQGRLSRRMTLQEGLLTSLQNELEAARIAEVNAAPVISLVDPAVPPVRHSWPRRTLIVVATWLVSFLLIVVVVSLYEYREWLVAGDPEGAAALKRRLSVVGRRT